MAAQNPGAKASDFAPLSLAQIDYFEFGESYRIELKTGVGIKVSEFSDLDAMLGIMRSEFASADNRGLIPVMELIDTRARPHLHIRDHASDALAYTANGKTVVKGIGRADRRVLIVSPGMPGSFLPPPPLAAIITMIQQAVTMFNLTGSWDQIRKENL